MSVYEAAKSNDRRATLEALRDATASQIDKIVQSPDLEGGMPNLTKRLVELIEEIDSLPDENKEPSPLEKARQAIES